MCVCVCLPEDVKVGLIDGRHVALLGATKDPADPVLVTAKTSKGLMQSLITIHANIHKAAVGLASGIARSHRWTLRKTAEGALLQCN